MIVFLLALCAHASFTHESIAPALTQAGLAQTAAHEVWTPTAPAERLLISIGGTGSVPGDFRSFDELAAGLNYFVVAIDYPNRVITTVCRNSQDPHCFDTFREEIMFGRDVNPFVHVDTANSIANRIRRLLSYLIVRDARWAAFWQGDDVAWNKVTLVGHSQGAGHVAYLAKRFEVARVIMLAGPQDAYSPTQEAAWLDARGMTPGARFFALLHQQDVFGSSMQLLCFAKLSGTSPVVIAHPEEIRTRASHVVVSIWPSANPHTDVMTPLYRNVWEYFLR